VLPLLFAEYFGANTASMLLLIGNPTNVIVGAALGIPFAEFTRVMWFPTLTAIAATGALLFWRFRTGLTRRFTVPDAAPFGVRSRWDAAFSSSVLLLMLGLLSVSHRLGVPIWMITAGAALVLIVEDLLFGIYYVGRKIRLPLLLRDEETIHAFEAYGIREHALESWITIKRVPWKIAPFVTVLFILVGGLNKNGLTALFEHQLAVLGDGTGLPVFVWGSAAALVCNLINNQPMTVLAARCSCTRPPRARLCGGDRRQHRGHLTILGALAGLMWKRILGTAGLPVSYREFFRHGIRIVPPVLLLSLAALLLVL
jgi:arsenical pump membrane protein